MISFDEALSLVKDTSKAAHVVVVSRIMRELALRIGENRQEWELVGLLHDLDYDETKTERNRHGVIASNRLKGRLPEHCLHAIRAHDYRTGVAPRSRLDKALIAVDSATLLMDRVGLRFAGPSVETLRRTLEGLVDQPWLRRNILEIENLGLNLDEFLQLCLGCLKEAQAT